MHKTLIIKVAIITSILGIILLLFLAENTELPLSKISSITLSSVEQQARLQGTILVLKSSETTIFTLQDFSGEIKVVVFSKLQEIKKGDFIEVIGKVQEYQGKPEILASEIKIL